MIKLKSHSAGNFGTKLQALICNHPYDLKYIASELGISERIIYYWIRGDSVPKNYKTVKRIANFFKVPERYFFDDTMVGVSEIIARLDKIEKRLDSLEHTQANQDISLKRSDS